MNNKRIVFLAILCLFGSFAFAQTKVIKTNAIKSNNFGVQYVLPKTVIEIAIDYTRTDLQAGQYARFASRYLGINENEVVMEDNTIFKLDKVRIRTLGVPNKDESYLVEFKPKTVAPFVYLTEDGMLCAINTEYTPEARPDIKQEQAVATGLRINPQSVYTEEYLRAGSASKMAEVAAKQIYRIRESRSDILTGESDNAPRDGEAMRIVMENLEIQERIWTELFTGTSNSEKLTATFTVEPTGNLEKEVLCRFSKYLGIVDADDLSGSPLYLNLTDQESVEIAEEDPKRKAREPQSIVYNVPGKADIEIIYGLQPLLRETIDVVQFGTTQILATSLFDDKKAPIKVLFYPNLGAIKEITQ